MNIPHIVAWRSLASWTSLRLGRVTLVLWSACVGIAISPALFTHAVAVEYRLSAGDALTFDFLDDTELPVTAPIARSGEASFPIIGAVAVVGLTIPEALAKLKAEYRTREVLVDPKLSLEVATFRPIFVLGEVRSPGSFAFVGGLTVEQAIGLAGGMQVIAANASDRIIARARLRGEIESANAEIVHEAVYAARLVAQLRSSEKIDPNDLPEIAREYVKGVPLDGVMEVEEKILKADLAARRSQSQILSEGITHSESGVGILNELVLQQRDVVKNGEEDLKRVADLRKRGLTTESDLSRAENTEASEKAHLLEVLASRERSRQEASSLKLQLAKLAADREKEILTQLQAREIAIKKLIAQKRAADEQILLMAAVAADEAKQTEISYRYDVRRRLFDGEPMSIKASPSSELLPGDVLLVSLAGM
jgi:protein involved in polysaccharide export with SLBB domain